MDVMDRIYRGTPTGSAVYIYEGTFAYWTYMAVYMYLVSLGMDEVPEETNEEEKK